VVLKESNPDFAREMFASVLARHLGVSAPRMRPLSLDEFKDLTEHLRSARISVKGTCGALHGPTAQEFGGVLMEFLPGEALLRTRYADAFEHAKFNRAVGRVVALDLLINKCVPAAIGPPPATTNARAHYIALIACRWCGRTRATRRT